MYLFLNRVSSIIRTVNEVDSRCLEPLNDFYTLKG